MLSSSSSPSSSSSSAQHHQRQPDSNWGYFPNQITPDQWPNHFKVGNQQSPINILVGSCRHCSATATKSTCCKGIVLNKVNVISEQGDKLAAQFRDKATLSKLRRRPHLDSVGEEDLQHERSLSASSVGSASSSSSSSSSSSRLNDGGDASGSESGDSDDSLCNRCAHKEEADRKSRAIKCNKLLNHLQQKQQKNKLQQNTRQVVSLRKLFLGYPRFMNTMQLFNTGHNWQVSLPTELSNHTLISGPSLGDREYRLAQFHCHWGEDCDHGSEHQINGKSYAAEIHFVHWNCTDFASAEEASRHRHGLAVLAVLVQALDGEQNRNKHLDKIIAGLKRVHKPGSAVTVNARLDLKKLFPANRWNYATYEGSLTTPPLSEVVDWLVFLDPIQCSTSQVDQFRQIRCPASGQQQQQQRLINNCRPVQPTGDRLVSIWSHH